MEFISFVVLIFSLCKIGSTLNQAKDLSIEDTVLFLKDKITQMEERMSSFELSLTVQGSQKGCLEDKNEILKKVSEVETRCEDISSRLQNAEVRFLRMDTHLLVEVQQAREKSFEAIERVSIAEQEVASALESKTDILQVQMNKTREMLNSFVASHRDTENVIRKNISSSTEKLMHLNDSLSSRFESLTTKMRIFENSLLEIEKDFANISFVSNLDQSFQHLNKAMKTDVQSIQSELSPRVEQLEVRCALCQDVAELNKTLRNHTLQINALNTDLLDIQNTCFEPPQIGNGYPLMSHRRNRHGAIVTYACRDNMTLAGSGEMVCHSGEWTGHLPECMNSCNTKDLKIYDGLDIPMNTIIQHSKSMDIRCRRDYVIASTSESLTCLNGTWSIRGDPCIKGFWDPTFILITMRTGLGYGYIQCNSVSNGLKIDFSRVLDTGSGAHLPVDVTKDNQYGFAYIHLGNEGSPEQFGSFQCGFGGERGSMNISVQMQDARGDLYFENHSKVANIGDAVELKVKFDKKRSMTWKHNGFEVLSWVNKEGVSIPSVQPSDAGIYECNYEGQRGVTAPALLRLIVRKCQKNLFGEHCDQQCPPCYNGGICHDHLGVCICPPGFSGDNCEIACGEYLWGEDCSLRVNEDSTFLYCLPDPYGCACSRGWKGLKCDERCEKGWYGADCKQPCHCALGSGDCHIVTGACPGGCFSGWTGQSCQIQVVD